jgi:hypothetical protein
MIIITVIRGTQQNNNTTTQQCGGRQKVYSMYLPRGVYEKQ